MAHYCHTLLNTMTKRNIFIVDNYPKSKQKRAMLRDITDCDIAPLRLNELQVDKGGSWPDFENNMLDLKSPEGGYSWYTHATDTCNVCTDGVMNTGSVESAL